MIPIVGLVISSFRTRFDIQTSGWWTIVPHREWQTVATIPVPEGVDRNGVMQIEGGQGTFEQFREGVQVGDTKLIWIGNRRTGTIEVQKESWTTNTDFTLDNYKQVIGGKSFEIRKPDGTTETVQGDNMIAPFLNSLIVTIPATVIPILIAAFAAYGFAWMKFPGRRLLFILVVALLVVPLQIAFVPILKDYASCSSTAPSWASGWRTPASACRWPSTCCSTTSARLPRDILESAFIDGASHFTIFQRLILPLSVPALASFAIFQFLWVWNDYLVALIFLGATPGNQVLTMFLANMVGSRGNDWHLLTAGALRLDDPAADRLLRPAALLRARPDGRVGQGLRHRLLLELTARRVSRHSTAHPFHFRLPRRPCMDGKVARYGYTARPSLSLDARPAPAARYLFERTRDRVADHRGSTRHALRAPLRPAAPPVRRRATISSITWSRFSRRPARLALARPADLKALDARREADPAWFQSQKMLGGVCYVDLFAGNLAGLSRKVALLQGTGLTYLHLMPLFKAPEGENDGGYAVSSYREVNPRLGTMAELSDLARELRGQGISLIVDFVFNHTSDEHEWARAAHQAGDPEYEDYYYIFPDRTMPDAYERTLREIFPDAGPAASPTGPIWASGSGRPSTASSGT